MVLASCYITNVIVDAVRIIGTAIGGKFNLGANVLNQHWDVLVVLDSLRVDALKTFTTDYDWLREIDTKWSTGGASAEWIANTFMSDVFPVDERVGIVTANPFYDMLINDGGDHESIDRVRRQGNIETSVLEEFDPFIDVSNTTAEHIDGRDYHAPHTVTDHAIHLGREAQPDRLVLHYMQPHRPFIGGAIDNDRPCEQWETEPWGYIQRTGDYTRVWEAYLNTTEWVLDDIDRLLNNYDGQVLITADHGEAIGELTAYEHHVGSFHPKIRRIPWTWATGTDRETCTVNVSHDETTPTSLDERLRYLGYK